MRHKLVKAKERPPTTTIGSEGTLASALVREMSRFPTLVARVTSRSQLVSDHVFLLLGEIDCGIRPSPNVVDSILLHEVLSHIRLIVNARQRTSLEDTNRFVFPGPGRTRTRLVLFEALVDIGGLADVILAVCELENVEGFHLECKN